MTRPYRRRVWGAVAATIGFIARMAGSKWLEQLLPSNSGAHTPADDETQSTVDQTRDGAGMPVPALAPAIPLPE